MKVSKGGICEFPLKGVGQNSLSSEVLFRSLNPNSCFKKRGGLYVSYTEEGHGNPFQYSRLENPMDRGALWAIICRVAKN